MVDVEDVTLGEIVRSLKDVREELRALRGEHVRRDLYEAHRAAVAADIDRLTKEDDRLAREIAGHADEHTNRNRQVTFALIGAGLSLVVQLIVLIVH